MVEESPDNPTRKEFTRSPELLRGIELARRYLSSRAKILYEQELAEYCLTQINAIVRRLVIVRGFGRPGEDSQALVEDIVGDVALKIVESLHTLKDPEQLLPWLKKVCMYALIDKFKKDMGRGPEKRQRKSIDMVNEEGERTSVVDKDAGREAAERYLGNSLTYMADATKWTKAIENRELLEKALTIHSRGGSRDFQSACWLKVSWDYPHISVEQMAAHRKTTPDDVYHLLSHDNGKLIPIVKKLLNGEAA
jgi:DNA-directed RNA polymerase specialized sigma24 family protein